MSRSTRKAHEHGLLEVTYVSLGINSIGKALYRKLLERKWGRTIDTHSWILGEYKLEYNDGTAITVVDGGYIDLRDWYWKV